MRVRQREQPEPEAGGSLSVERHGGMRRGSEKQCLRMLAVEAARDGRRASERGGCETPCTRRLSISGSLGRCNLTLSIQNTSFRNIRASAGPAREMY